MLIKSEEAKRIYEAWLQSRADYEKEVDLLLKAIYARESAMLLQMFINATDD